MTGTELQKALDEAESRAASSPNEPAMLAWEPTPWPLLLPERSRGIRLNELLMVICLVLVFIIGYLTREKAINGNKTICAAWLVERNDRGSDDLTKWMIGYLATHKYIDLSRPDDAPDPMDAPNLLMWIDGYCTANPLDSIETAGMAYGARHKHP
jgi:hypothetical protein